MKTEYRGKIVDESYALRWLENHFIMVQKFILSKWFVEDFELILKRMISQPVISYRAINDFRELNSTKLNNVFDYLNYGSLIVLVVGKRGSGKSCTVHYLCKQLKKLGRDIYYIGPPMNIDNDFYHSFDLHSTPMNSINVIDESVLLANSRKAMSNSNIGLTEILPTLRHVGKTIFVITQNSSMTDINFYKMADVLLIKQFSLMQQNTERQLFDVAFQLFTPIKKSEVFFYSDGLITNFDHRPHPEWNDNLSKAYRFIESEVEARKYIVSLLDNDYKIKDVKNLLRIVGFVRDMGWYEENFVRSS